MLDRRSGFRPLAVLLLGALAYGLAGSWGAISPWGAASAGKTGTAGAPGIVWSDGVRVDTGPGRVGPWRMNRSDWRYVDDPTVALGPTGSAAVAWVDQARKDVLLQRYDAAGEPFRDEPVNVSRSPGIFSWLPRIAIGPEGRRIYLLWQEIVFSGGTHGGEAFFARSTDGGRTWDKPINLSETRAGAGKGRLTPERWHNGSLDLALGPEGRIYAAWTVYEGGLFITRSDNRGRTFAEPVRVSTEGSEPARGPSLAVAPDGAVHLAWALGGSPRADLRYAVSPGGTLAFPEPGTLLPGPHRADAPKLAIDSQGAIHLAYTRAPADRKRGYTIRYARAPAGEGFGEARAIAARPEGGFTGAGYPSLALDGQGNPHLVWELYREGRPRSRGLGFTRSADKGRTFAAPALVPGTADPRFLVNGSLQGSLLDKLAVGPGGEVAVVNSGFQPGEASRVRLIRGRPEGP